MAHKEQAPRPDMAASKRRLSPSSVREPARTAPRIHPAAAVARMKAHPLALNARAMTQLQRSIGNRAVVQLLSAAREPRPDGSHVRAVDEEEMDAVGVVQRKENRTGLADNLKMGVESLSGFSLDDVKVHYNSDAPALVGALAYTRGTDIHVAPGQERHLAHEVWHVVQQKRGRVRPTLRLGGLEVNDDAHLEAEADVMGARARHLNPATSAPMQLARVEPVLAPTSSLVAPIQLLKFKSDEQATTWLATAIQTVLTAQRGQNADNFTREKMETYLSNLSGKLYTYEGMEKLLRAQGGEYYAAEHRIANLTSELSKATVIEAALNQLRGVELTRHYGAKKRTVTAEQQEHIFLGTVNNAENPTTVTGYHWEGDGASVAVSSGAKQGTEGKFGVYQRGVVARAKPSTKKAGGSATASTFFPDAWGKDEVLEAIEYANVSGAHLEARTPGKAIGLLILSNADSYFPKPPEEQPDA